MFELRDDGQFILQAIHFDDADSPACVGSVEPDADFSSRADSFCFGRRLSAAGKVSAKCGAELIRVEMLSYRCIDLGRIDLV